MLYAVDHRHGILATNWIAHDDASVYISKKIPFGALVEFKPSDARGDKREKFEPKGETGIFAGCNLSSGLHWARKCRAWALTSFAGVDLSSRKAKIPPRLRQPHQTERMVLKIPISFPIQEKYKKRNETLEGVEEIRGEDDRGVHLEQPAEDEDPDPTLLQGIDQRQLDEAEEIAGIVTRKVRMSKSSSRGARKTKTLLRTSLTYPTYQQGKPKMVSSTGMIWGRRSGLLLVGDPIQSVRMDSGR